MPRKSRTSLRHRHRGAGEGQADLPAGHHLSLTLQLAHHRLEIEARIAHLESRPEGWALGLGLVFPKFEVQQAYLQLLQPVVIGQSLQPMAYDRVVQDDPQFFKRVFLGNPTRSSRCA